MKERAINFVSPTMYLTNQKYRSVPCICSVCTKACTITSTITGEHIFHVLNPHEIGRSTKKIRLRESLSLIEEMASPRWKEIPKNVTLSYLEWPSKTYIEKTFTEVEEVNTLLNCMQFMNDHSS